MLIVRKTALLVSAKYVDIIKTLCLYFLSLLSIKLFIVQYIIQVPSGLLVITYIKTSCANVIARLNQSMYACTEGYRFAEHHWLTQQSVSILS